jgi:hypothetical protein
MNTDALKVKQVSLELTVPAQALELLPPGSTDAPLPAMYERAKTALAECARIDECQDWADKAEALASYARQVNDDELRRTADRIQARAIHQAGKLLKEIPPGPGGRPAKTQEGALPSLTRSQAAENAGLSEHQRKTALRVANIPFDELVRTIESANPPTITELAERGLIKRGSNTGVAMSPHAERNDDFYPTPECAVRALLKVESFSGPIWECACGNGAIVNVLRQTGHKVIATNLVDYSCPDSTSGVDFLMEQRAPAGVDTILTNPPFMFADKFVRHALTLVPRVVMLLRFLFIESQGRCDIIDGGQLRRV